MTPDDVRLIERIQQTTRGARVLLCTLARRGKALEREQPERAAFLLGALRPHPLYKAGRLAFDMLEIEDLMLDGAAVDPLTDFQLAQMLSAVAGRGYDLADVFLRVGSNGRDGTPDAALPAVVAPRGETPGATDGLPRLRFGPEAVDGAGGSSSRDGDGPGPGPELTSSDYLYDLVVLGFLDVLGRSLPV
ncbi:MAG TPA: hypothetical protein VID28_02825 [Methylomirabilota bacterium]|jgi:hypothetical protein